MELVESARVDVLCYLHTSIERRAGEIDKLVKVAAKKDVVAVPSLFEAAFDLDAKFARTALEVLATWLALPGAGSVQDAHKNTANEVFCFDLVGMQSIIEAAIFHVEAVGADLNLEAGHRGVLGVL